MKNIRHAPRRYYARPLPQGTFISTILEVVAPGDRSLPRLQHRREPQCRKIDWPCWPSKGKAYGPTTESATDAVRVLAVLRRARFGTPRSYTCLEVLHDDAASLYSA